MKNNMNLKHLLIIPDGNRRWARTHNKPFNEVYAFVALQITPMLIKRALITHGVSEITLFMMSRNNLIKRSLNEVMPILEAQERMYYSLVEDQDILKNNIKFKIIGDKTLLPKSYLESCDAFERINKNGIKKCNILVGYDAEWEVATAMKKIKRIECTDIVNQLILNSEIDLMIRTGFEKRISGGPLFQLKYAELFFCDFHYPELTAKKFDGLMKSYYKIERRFGK